MSGGQWVCGPRQYRDRDSPDRFTNLQRDDAVVVRQANAMAKRAIKGLLEAARRGRYASLEHPYDSYIWYLPEMQRVVLEHLLVVLPRRGSEWLTVVHKSASLHAVLDKPTCDGHDQDPFRLRNPENNSEYPWPVCLVFLWRESTTP